MPGAARKILWFGTIWLSSVVALGIIGLIIKLVLRAS